MNHCNLQQNAVFPCDEMRGLVSICDQKDMIICPKPRRVGILANNPIRPFRLHMSQTADMGDLRAGAELLDIFCRKEDYEIGKSGTIVASSPPFFAGSPPSRATNPIVQDSRFGEEKLTPTSALSLISSPGLPSPSSATPRKGACVRMKFGFKPAAIRVEGFDCLNRDRQNSSVPAMA